MPKKKRKFPKPPRPEEISAAREHYGLTQEEAGALIYYTLNGWQRLEYGERALQPALWEHWRFKAAIEAENRAPTAPAPTPKKPKRPRRSR